jgi:NAD(P) transhydrogenase subunit alpha
MNPTDLANQAQATAERALALAEQARRAAEAAAGAAAPAIAEGAQVVEPFLYLLTIFLLACFVGYYVVWNVTPALHSPLMAVTNAISSVIVVGAILATGLGGSWAAVVFGFLAAMLAAVNIFGGFLVTRRMLAMFKRKG